MGVASCVWLIIRYKNLVDGMSVKKIVQWKIWRSFSQTGKRRHSRCLQFSYNPLLNLIYSSDLKGSKRSSDFGHNPQLCQ